MFVVSLSHFKTLTCNYTTHYHHTIQRICISRAVADKDTSVPKH